MWLNDRPRKLISVRLTPVATNCDFMRNLLLPVNRSWTDR